MDWDQIKIRKPGLIGPSRWNWLVEQIKSALIQNVVGGTWQRGPGGTSLWLDGSSGGTLDLRPFQLVDASTEEDGIRIRIYNGRLGGLLPGEMSLGDDPHYYLYLSNGTHFIVGQVSVGSNGIFSGASVYNNGSSGLPPANGNTVYLLIGRVVVSTSSGQPAIQLITQEAAGNQGLVVFASADGSLLQPMWVPQEIP